VIYLGAPDQNEGKIWKRKGKRGREVQKATGEGESYRKRIKKTELEGEDDKLRGLGVSNICAVENEEKKKTR